jgi:hypothetical protein
VTTWRLYVIGAAGMALALYVLHLWRETRDELAEARAEQAEQIRRAVEAARLERAAEVAELQRQVARLEELGAQVRARPASIEEARASERRGKSYDARLEAVVQEGTRWRIRK